MTKTNGWVKTLAAVLIVALQCLYVPASAGEESAAITGTVFSAADQAPLVGVKVHAGDPRTGEIHSSGVTGADGSFEIAELATSTYEIGVESDGALFLVSSPVTLAPGQTRSVNLSVNAEAPDPASAKAAEAAKKPSLWNNPMTAALFVLLGAVGLGMVIDGAVDDKNATGAMSPSGS